MFRTKFLLAVLMTLLLSSLNADRTEAGWHHWGYGYYPYAYSSAPLYRPVVARHPYHGWSYRPILGHRWARYRLHYGYGYYLPGYAWYGAGCCWAGCGGPVCYTVQPYCCESTVVDSYKAIVPSDDPEDSAADRAPELPAVPAEQPTPAVPEPADTLPSLPPQPGLELPELPDPGATLPQSPQPAPVTPDSPDPALPLLPDDSALLRQPAGSATLALQVPSEARVFVNGMLTRTPGTYRQYVSRGLLPGHDYTYEVRVEVERNGRTYRDVRTVNLRAGGSRELVFRRNQPLDLAATHRPVETTLTLRVPETARVTLEGHAIAATGEVRTFVTRELPDGERWEGYRVVVEIEQDGRVESSAKTIDLVGGGRHELSFDFAAQHVALR
jgi:uncharacterized protein (TIGR03000 family)